MLDFLGVKFYAVTAALAAIGMAFVFAWRQTFKAGANAKEVEHAEARRKNLEKIKRAADARARGGVLDDPHNRDND